MIIIAAVFAAAFAVGDHQVAAAAVVISVVVIYYVYNAVDISDVAIYNVAVFYDIDISSSVILLFIQKLFIMM